MKLFAVLEYMKCGQVVTHPCAPPKKPRATASSKVSSSGEHVQFFRMVYARKKGFQAFVGFLCLIACRNMGVNLKFHVSTIFLCLHGFGNVGGRQGALTPCARSRVCG